MIVNGGVLFGGYLRNPYLCTTNRGNSKCNFNKYGGFFIDYRL